MSQEMTDRQFAEHQLAASAHCETNRELYSARKFVLRLAAIAGVNPGDFVPGFSEKGNQEGLIAIRAGQQARMAEIAVNACTKREQAEKESAE